MKHKLLAMTIGAAVSMGAIAAPVALPSGPIYIKFDNLEQIALAGDTGYANEINWGVLVVSSANSGVVSGTDPNVINTGGTSFFNNGTTNNGQITGIFYGIEGLAAGTGGNAFPATAGHIDLYWRDLGTYGLSSIALAEAAGPGIRTAQDQATGFTDGILLATLDFASGIISTNSSVTIAGSIVPTPGTGFAGLATSYANVNTSDPRCAVVGSCAWNDKFDTDYFTTAFGTRDFRFRNIYEEDTAWSTSPTLVGARSTDPATTFVVPEPGSLALVGLGLLGVAGLRRRRKVA